MRGRSPLVISMMRVAVLLTVLFNAGSSLAQDGRPSPVETGATSLAQTHVHDGFCSYFGRHDRATLAHLRGRLKRARAKRHSTPTAKSKGTSRLERGGWAEDTFGDHVELILRYSRDLIGRGTRQSASQISRNITDSLEIAAVPNAVYDVTDNGWTIAVNNNFVESLTAFSSAELRQQDNERSFFKHVDPEWPVFSVLAHLVGHAVFSHRLRQGMQTYEELEADWYSGLVLRKMGAGSAAAIYAVQRFAPETGTATHPSKADRVSAILAGYEFACARDPQCAPRPRSDVKSVKPKTALENLSKSKGWPPSFGVVCNINGSQYLLDDGYGFVFSRRLMLDKRLAQALGTTFPVTGLKEFERAPVSPGTPCKFNIAIDRIGLICVRADGTAVADPSSSATIGFCRRCSDGLCPSVK